MKERPILFSGPMVRAVLAEIKLQTRRGNGLEYFSDPANDPDGWWCARVRDGVAYMVYKQTPHEREVKCPYGTVGDRLWVREAWADDVDARWEPQKRGTYYRADDDAEEIKADCDAAGIPFVWRPSIHMHRWRSRITLEIADVRVERLQRISEADCIAEGAPGGHGSIPGYLYNATPHEHFLHVWESVNGPGAWDANPWVWVVEFKQIKPDSDSATQFARPTPAWRDRIREVDQC